QLGTRIGPIELLWNRGSPAIQEVGAERNYERCSIEIKTRPRHTIRGGVRRDRFGIDAGVVAHMRRHAEIGEPLVQKRGKRAGLVLIDEYGVGRATARARLAQLLRKQLERLVPLGRDQLAVLANHRRAVAIGIVQRLHFRLTGGAERTAVHRMRWISFELGGASVACLRDHAAARSAASARRRVVGRYTRNGVVGRYQVRDELLDSIGLT